MYKNNKQIYIIRALCYCIIILQHDIFANVIRLNIMHLNISLSIASIIPTV